MTPTVGQRLAEATRLLAAVSETPRLDAEILLARALGLSRARLLARLGEAFETPDFDDLLERRLTFEPIAYILGEWEFYGRSFEVEAPILVPRPETEHLVEVVLDGVGTGPAAVLEIGTGTGCVAVTVAVQAPRVRMVATDIRWAALALARRNVRRHGAQGRVALAGSDLFGGLSPGRQFDVVCSNPPYVDEATWHAVSPVVRLHEDPRALLAGHDGLDVVRRIVAECPGYLRPGGLLCFEIGDTQRDAVHGLLLDCGYSDVGFVRDLGGIDRIVKARLPV